MNAIGDVTALDEGFGIELDGKYRDPKSSDGIGLLRVLTSAERSTRLRPPQMCVR